MAQQIESLDQEQTSGGNNAGFGEFASGRYRGMGFTPARSSLTAIEFDRNKGSKGIKIYLATADADSIPTQALGSELYSWTVTNATITGAIQKFTLPIPQTLTIGAQYVFYIAPWDTTTDLYADDYQDMVWTPSNVYTGGKPVVNNNGTWSVSDAGNLDAQFKTYGYEPVIYDVVPKTDFQKDTPKINYFSPTPKTADLGHELTDRLYPYVQTVGMYTGLPFGLTYTVAGTVNSPYAP